MKRVPTTERRFICVPRRNANGSDGLRTLRATTSSLKQHLWVDTPSQRRRSRRAAASTRTRGQRRHGGDYNTPEETRSAYCKSEGREMVKTAKGTPKKKGREGDEKKRDSDEGHLVRDTPR